MLLAGVVGRPHGLDGSFYLTAPRGDLLSLGGSLTIAGQRVSIERLAGTAARPILRVSGCADRAAAEALRGQQLLVAESEAPPLGEDEYRAEELAGARVIDGELEVGVVRELVVLPSCECLAVERPGGGELLVPLVRDAIRSIDVAQRLIEVDTSFLGEREGGA
jgi:16S rRNA processing protein RimM